MYKTPGPDHFLEVEMSKKCAPLWREAHFEVKMYKTPGPDHFWKLRCRNSARRCGAKHISMSKVQKTFGDIRSTFGQADVVLRGKRKGLCTLSKMSET